MRKFGVGFHLAEALLIYPLPGGTAVTIWHSRDLPAGTEGAKGQRETIEKRRFDSSVENDRFVFHLLTTSGRSNVQ